ncbi:MAG: hypothetical protein ACTHLH_03890 [Solirubrobacterales bacterium]
MTDASQDLRAALEKHQDEDDQAKREREEVERQRRAFELKEDDVRQHLYEVADLTVAAIAKTEPEKILIMPKRRGLGGLFDADKYAHGWQVAWGRERVLCANGVLIRPGSHTDYGRSIEPEYSTVRSWIDDALRRIRTSNDESNRDYFREAFEHGPTAFKHVREENRQRLYSGLEEVKRGITERLAKELHERGITLSAVPI